LIIGGVDESYYSNLEYLEVAAELGLWAVLHDKVLVNGVKLVNTSYFSVLDTGTSLIIGPNEEVYELYYMIA